MAGGILIHAERISKRYLLRGKGRVKESFKDVLARHLSAPFGRRGEDDNGVRRIVKWALKDVSLKVRQGEIITLVGRNGSGKTTLLKILAGITQPTSGSVSLGCAPAIRFGRGVGFNPNLTGRQTLYLSGCLMGLSSKVIDSCIDEIIAFADIDPDYIEQPVKYYSSGMSARLGFAILTQVHGKIILIDEALAAGDPGFRLKCRAELKALMSRGSTIMVATQEAELVRNFATRCIRLEKGRVIADGDPTEVFERYIADLSRPRV